MTLDLEKFIANSIKMQAKIQHLDVNTKTVKKIPMSVQSLIIDEYGENYLEDADYVSFFWGQIGKDEIKKLFNVVDRALGKSANKLTETDFKKIKINKDDDDDDKIEDSDNDVEDVEDDNDTEDVEVDNDVEDIDDDDDDEVDNDVEDDNDIEEELDEDDSSILVKPHTSYFFLKITLK